MKIISVRSYYSCNKQEVIIIDKNSPFIRGVIYFLSLIHLTRAWRMCQYFKQYNILSGNKMRQPFLSCLKLSIPLCLISLFIIGYGSAVCAQKSAQVANAVAVNDAQSEEQNPFKKGDAFRLMVTRDTVNFLTGIYQIDDNGEALLPLVGKVKVDNWSEKKLTKYLDSLYLPYLRYPDLRVQPLIRVAMLGGYLKPGMYYLSPTSSLWDALAQAGGTAREDGLKKIHWERGNAVVKNNLLPDIEAGASLSKIGIRSGDQLWVTHEPKREGWDIFKSDVLPMLTITISTAATIATLYLSFQTYQSYQGNR